MKEISNNVQNENILKVCPTYMHVIPDQDCEHCAFYQDFHYVNGRCVEREEGKEFTRKCMEVFNNERKVSKSLSIPKEQKKKVVVVVRGGCVESVHSSEDLEIEVFDYDNKIEQDTKTTEEEFNSVTDGLKNIY